MDPRSPICVSRDRWRAARFERLVLLVSLVVISFASVARSQEIDYLRQIKPLLAERCFACHGALKQNAGLRVDTAALAIKGGKHGPAIKPGDPAGSELIARISSNDDLDRMPPEGEPLKPAQVAAIRAWIAGGAKAPVDEQPERDARDHWAFKPPVKPAQPKVADTAWSHGAIDAFIAQLHASRGLTPQPLADKRTWLRRVTLDLAGLPPTREEFEAFLADDSPDAFEKVADRLLASPRYGERWGRHWMDIWRYSDWWGLGAEVRNSQKHIWHWRDWIVESLNANKGYDQMLREMLAADELYPNDMDKLRAGGFLARQYFKFNRTSWLDETIEHTGKAMLGLTFNCAKCHDHKYDPISQVEYYQLRAFFEPYQVRTDFVAGELDPEKNGIPRPFDCNLNALTHRHIRGDERNPDKSRAIAPKPPAFLATGEMVFAPIELPAEAHQPGLRDFNVKAHLRIAEQRIEQSQTQVRAAQEKLARAQELAKAAAAQAAAAQATPDGPKLTPPVETKKPMIREDFAAAKGDVWEMRGGAWAYAGGKLTQSQTGATRAALRLKQAPPADFEARLKYVPTGGEMWKSVGIAFDVGDDGHMVTAYLSSFAGGPKSQITFKRNGGDVYPPEAAQSRKVELDKAHEITLRVRGTLVNVLVDGEVSIVYRLPIERKKGALELSTFDAKAHFLAFELIELASDVRLDEPASTKPKDAPLTPQEAAAALRFAESSLRHAQAQLESVRSRAAAQRGQHARPKPGDLASLVTEAARGEKIVARAKAEEDVARAELEMLSATAPKKAEVQQRRDGAIAALEKARKAVESPGDQFTPLVGSLKMFESNLESDESRRKPYPATSTGRRAALAAWITDARNPLTARVAVNHIWARHMGAPIVATVFDFGRKGAAPTHADLLDYLAADFVEHGYDMKRLHRLIVTSRAYRLSSSNVGAAAANLARDPDNRYHWRANPIRMEAQSVRDSLLYLAGELDLTMGGPSIPVSDEASRRRSLYFVHSHNEHQKFLSLFDDASVLDCYRRSQSIVPQQALALENSPLAAAMAQKIAQRIGAQPMDDARFIREAFALILGAEPNNAEQAAMAQAMAQLTAAAKSSRHANPAMQARANLVHALLNHNDFVTIR